MTATRTLVAWCPDWPVVAAGVPPDQPVAVLHANRVVACSEAARAEGVRRGLRRREAQSRCPELAVLPADPARDARAFEPVAAAVETLTPRVEVVRPGLCAFATRGPSRYFGGDAALAARTATVVDAVLLGRGSCQVGVADGSFAAALAARRAAVVEPGGSAAFLAPMPVDVLSHAPALAGAAIDLADVLRRLGLRTLGDLAALPPGDLAGRFGRDGLVAARLAAGLDEHPPATRQPPPELTVTAELDPPAERVETAAFIARTLAEDLHERLAEHGLACLRVSIEAETEHGESLARLWRHEGALGAAAIAERMRWQLDGWLNRQTWAGRPSGGIAVLRLVPDQVVPDAGRQLGFWGGSAAATERAARAAARVQGLLGPEAVRIAERRGGRGPAEQVSLLPVDAVSLGEPPTLPVDATGPWPGRVPSPAPAVVPPDPLPAVVVDAAGDPVVVDARGEASAPPARLAVGGGAPVDVTAWAGPWLADERWWDPGRRRRRVRIQVSTADGRAHLLALEAGRWSVEAIYD